MELRKAMRQLRKELMLTQTELAEALNVTYASVNRWENSKNVPKRAMAIATLNYAREHGASIVCQETLKDTLFPSVKRSGIDDLKYAEMSQINNLLNDSSNGVAVCDQETYELLYANRQAAIMAGQSLENADGQKCYEYFYHRDTPCPDCQMRKMDQYDFTKWEKTMPHSGRKYMMRGKKIIWNDRPAHIEYMTDITEHYMLQEHMRESKEILSAATGFAEMWVFIYDVQRDIVYPDMKLQEQFHIEPVVRNFPETVFRWNMVLPESIPAYREMTRKIKEGNRQAEAEIQSRYFDEQIHWLRFRMNIISYDEMGKPKIAVCSAQPIDREKAMERRIRAEHEKMLTKNTHLLGYVVSNISKNLILEHGELQENSPTVEESVTFDEGVRLNAGRIEPESGREVFLRLHQREQLLKDFGQGKISATLENQHRLPNGRLWWTHSEMKLMMDPVSGDILLYEYCYDIHEHKMFDGLMSAAALYNFDYLGAVSLVNRQLTTIVYLPEQKRNEMTILSYDEEVEKACQALVVEADADYVRKCMDLDHVVEELKTKSVYGFTYRSPDKDGKVHLKQNRFSWFDKEQQICLVSSMDVEEIVADAKLMDSGRAHTQNISE